MNFETKATGKWILAGEHAVLRGSPALVFPLPSSFVQLSYMKVDSTEGLHLVLEGEHGKELQLLFWGVLERACELMKISRNQISGKIKIYSSIPIGAGLGASAALSVAMSRWFQFLGYIQADLVQDFACTLENLFHGESSGVDIAVAISGNGLRFLRHGDRIKIEPQDSKDWWSPFCFLSYSGRRGVTMDCVSKVKELILKNPELGIQIDQDMQKAVELAEPALFQDKVLGFKNLKKAIEMAHSCFRRWDLIDVDSAHHMEWLKEQGAVAVKPTGSGNGGYILSLWGHEPDVKIKEKLISCF